MTGKIYCSVFPYYDSVKKQRLFKKRPVLIISDIRNGDYNVLPISKISRQDKRDPEYDISIPVNAFPNLALSYDSFIRVHKQTMVHQGDLIHEISDLAAEYKELYIEVIDKLDQYNSLLRESLLSIF